MKEEGHFSATHQAWPGQAFPDWNTLNRAGAFGNEVSSAVMGLVGHCTMAGSFFLCHLPEGMSSSFTYGEAGGLRETPCSKWWRARADHQPLGGIVPGSELSAEKRQCSFMPCCLWL